MKNIYINICETHILTYIHNTNSYIHTQHTLRYACTHTHERTKPAQTHSRIYITQIISHKLLTYKHANMYIAIYT